MVTLEDGESYPVEIAPTLIAARETLTAVAVDLAAESPVLALIAVQFSILDYAMPGGHGTPSVGHVPPSHHMSSTDSISDSGRRCTRFTFFSGDGVRDLRPGVGRVWLLGYPGAFALAVVAGILRSFPSSAPAWSSLPSLSRISSTATSPGRTGDRIRLVFVGFLLDAVIDRNWFDSTTGLPASLDVVGFTGGVLHWRHRQNRRAGEGLLVELSSLLTSERQGDQQRLT